MEIQDFKQAIKSYSTLNDGLEKLAEVIIHDGQLRNKEKHERLVYLSQAYLQLKKEDLDQKLNHQEVVEILRDTQLHWQQNGVFDQFSIAEAIRFNEYVEKKEKAASRAEITANTFVKELYHSSSL